VIAVSIEALGRARHYETIGPVGTTQGRIKSKFTNGGDRQWPKARKKVTENPKNPRRRRSKRLQQRRARRAVPRGGSRTSDQARRNRMASLLSGLIGCCLLRSRSRSAR